MLALAMALLPTHREARRLARALLDTERNLPPDVITGVP